MRLFTPEEGRAGVTVTFVAILELVREGLIDIMQTEAYAPLHVRAAAANRTLHLVADNAPLDPAAPASEIERDPAGPGAAEPDDSGVME